MDRGRLIAIEGIDGSGTTTLLGRLAKHLRERSRAVHETREPSDGPVGRLLREMLAGGHLPPDGEAIDRVTLGLLFAADRTDHVQREVAPALGRGELVLSDRWYHSSLAYQGAAADRAWIRELNRHAPAPDLTLFVEVSPALAAERRRRRGGDREIFDDLDVQQRIATGYTEVIAALQAEGEAIAVIDGAGSPEVVLAAALAEIDRAGLG